MLFLMFFYILAAVMFFQGQHLLGETTAPLGTLPEEVGQNQGPSRTWGAYLMTFSAVMVVAGVASRWVPFFESTLRPLRLVAVLNLGAFTFWILFRGRTVAFMGEPTVEDHDHGHAHH